MAPKSKSSAVTKGKLPWITLAALLAAGVLAWTAIASLGDHAIEKEPVLRRGLTNLAAADTESPAAAPTTAPAPVAGKTSRPALEPPKGIDSTSILRTLASLGAVIALIVILGRQASRFLARTRLKPKGERVLEVIDAIPLGPKRQVYVVGCHGRRLVLGASGDRIQLIAEIGEDEIAALARRDERDLFADRLQAEVKRRGPAEMVLEAQS